MVDDNIIESVLDLNAEIVKHPASTFYARVSGDSMKDANIRNGDLLVIDKSLDPEDGDVAVCCLNGEFTLKYIKLESNYILLVPANEKYETIKITPEELYDDTFKIWGIVTHVIHSYRK